MPDFTNRLNLQKPAGGSSGTIPGDDQADIDVLNDNADKIDAAIGARYVTSTTRPATPFDGQIIKETDTKQILLYSQATGQWEPADSIRSGTAALRDLIYGTPAAGAPGAAARVALAAKAPQWFNTEKGYLQQYFAQWDDPGVGIYAKDTPGWGLAAHLKETPLANFSVSGTAATFSKRGAVAICTAGTTLNIDGIFNADFADYRILLKTTAGSLADIISHLRVAGVPDTANTYSVNGLIISSGGAPAYPVAGAATTFTLGLNTTTGSTYEILLRDPFGVSPTSHLTRVYTQSNQQEFRGGTFATAKSFDGLSFAMAAGNWTGRVRIFGINDF